MPDIFTNDIGGLLGVIGVKFVMPSLGLEGREGPADGINNFS